MTLEEMQELAKLIYPGRKIEKNQHGEPLVPAGHGWEIFSPNIDGTQREQAQACRVIVAATKIGYLAEFTIKTGSVSLVIWKNEAGCVETTVSTMVGRDILSAAIQALLHGQSGEAE
jgi:hypothetical protein